ncbi:DUF2252 domain-containing protein [Aldersonia sp. NBC_00410]|uniref:DUF2252 domain-containing protein n=1 Tax=Aldersonia sp. NBC_00410 TaxID=2975954 RepID=UPI002256C456|nr:DUF2252 domain-containing protein [Aldersonia sp. NBC_00410]MCX5043903.1 DUF2252 domain-containing protein [Aldersonia sp. NBC_00410]
MTSLRVSTESARKAGRKRGKAERGRVPRSALAVRSSLDRPDPVGLLESQARTRVPDLVPIRYGRMAQSAFAFFRGAALVMADDLARSPSTGLRVQLCGDAHMSNFGVYATPERKLTFDVNDFDETYPGPFEWDVKRLAASLVVGALDRDFGVETGAAFAREAAGAYRQTMIDAAGQGNLDVWYAHIDVEADLREIGVPLDGVLRKRIDTAVRKARGRSSEQILGKLTVVENGTHRIVSMPPLIVPVEELFHGERLAIGRGLLEERMREYAQTLSWDRRVLFDRFTLTQFARKVVGVGSVGTRCWIALLQGADSMDPLFLQIKEAQPSVLAVYSGGPAIVHQGERVVNGQRLMQGASDIFLGWVRGPAPDGVVRDFYVRQLRDGKWSVDIATMPERGLQLYARVCGRTLAQAHARAGDRFAVAGYLGNGTAFDDAIVDFAVDYADRSATDHAALCAAIDSGRVHATMDL